MKAALQLALIAARLWPLLAIGAAFTTAAQNSPGRKADEARYPKPDGALSIKIKAPKKTFVALAGGGHFAVFTKSEQFLRELIERVRPLASK
jgi:hypothetical protein